MDLLHLVDRLEELVASAQKMPIGSRAIIDRRRLLDIVDQMRIVIPQEVREAQEIVSHRDRLHREAEEEARIVVARAEEQASRLVETHEITTAARTRAEEVAREAGQRLEQRIAEANADIQERLAESRRLAQQQMAETDEYSSELLQRLERQLEAFVGSVRTGLTQLEGARVASEVDRVPDASVAPLDVERTASMLEAIEPLTVPAEAPVSVGATVDFGDYERSPEPIPLRTRDGDQPALDDAVEELENLLRRGPGSAEAASAETAKGAGDAHVIDDFANPRLDDEPGEGGPRV